MVTLSSGEWTIDWQIHGHRRRRSLSRLIHFSHVHIQTPKFQREPALWLSFSAPILSPLSLLLLHLLLHCLVHHHHHHQVSLSLSLSLSLSHLLFLFTFLIVADKIFMHISLSHWIRIEQRHCCFIIYSLVATLPYFIFNHILSWVFLQTRKDHFNLHLYLLAWVASKG